MLSANWRRGLFRLWIAASFLWMVGAGAVFQKVIRRDVSTLMMDRPPGAFDEYPIVDDLIAQENLMFVASVILLPPILVLALGWAGLWIVRGFRSYMIRKLALGSLFCLWLLSILVPPWQRDRPAWEGRQMVSELAGYGWIFEGPFNTGPGFPRIDYRRLALEWLFLGSLGGAIVYFQRRKP